MQSYLIVSDSINIKQRYAWVSAACISYSSSPTRLSGSLPILNEFWLGWFHGNACELLLCVFSRTVVKGQLLIAASGGAEEVWYKCC